MPSIEKSVTPSLLHCFCKVWTTQFSKKKKKKFAQMTAILSILIKVHSHVCDIFRQVKAL